MSTDPESSPTPTSGGAKPCSHSHGSPDTAVATPAASNAGAAAPAHRRHLRIDCHTHILPSSLPPDYYLSYKQQQQQHNSGGESENGNSNSNEQAPQYVSFEPCSGSCNVRMFQNGRFFREVEENCFSAEARYVSDNTSNYRIALNDYFGNANILYSLAFIMSSHNVIL